MERFRLESKDQKNRIKTHVNVVFSQNPEKNFKIKNQNFWHVCMYFIFKYYIQLLNQLIDFAWHFQFNNNQSLKLLSFVLWNLPPFRNIFVNFFNTSMFLSRGIRGTKGAHPPLGCVKYMLFRGVWPIFIFCFPCFTDYAFRHYCAD